MKPAERLVTRASWPLWRIAVGSVLVLGLATSFAPQGLHFFDPAIQLLALRQSEAGVSASWNSFMRVDPLELTRDVPELITWWPPSTQLAVLPFRHLGLSIGGALRVVSLAAILIGALGWTRWFARFALPRGWLLALVIGLPWLRCASVGLFRYSAEVLAFAVAPWLLNAFAALLPGDEPRPRAGAWFIAGVAVGASYLVKYSLGLTGFAMLGAAASWQTISPSRAARRFIGPAAAAIGAALVPLGWHILIKSLDSATPVGHADPATFDPMGFAFLLANPALAIADAFGPLFYLIVFPGWGPLATGSLNTLAWIALPAGLVLALLLSRALRSKHRTAESWLAVMTLAGMSLLLFVLWFVADVSHEPRIITPAALAALPVALAHGRAVHAAGGHGIRAVLMVAMIGFVVAPFVWGPLYVAGKVRQAAGQATGETRLALPTLQTADIAACVRELRQHTTEQTLWVVPDPELALELPGRTIYLRAGRSIAEDLRNSYLGRTSLGTWQTSTPVELAVLLPDTADHRLPAVLATAKNISAWERRPLAHSELVLWRGRMSALR